MEEKEDVSENKDEEHMTGSVGELLSAADEAALDSILTTSVEEQQEEPSVEVVVEE
jgi:hypothetical protein